MGLTSSGGAGPRHVAVIGAGIVGVCTALYLQRDGHRVTLIDRLGPGEGTSKGNAAVIAAEVLRARGHAGHPLARAGHADGPARTARHPLALPAEAGALAVGIREGEFAQARRGDLPRAPPAADPGRRVLRAAAEERGHRGHAAPHRLARRLRDREEVRRRAGRFRAPAPPRRPDDGAAGRGDPPVRAEPGADLQARRLLPGERLRHRQLPPGAGASREPRAQRRHAAEGGGARLRARPRRPHPRHHRQGPPRRRCGGAHRRRLVEIAVR